MKGIITRTTSFQDWWGDRIGEEVEITGQHNGQYVVNIPNNFGALMTIPTECIQLTDNHPDLSNLTDDVLLEEVKRRGLGGAKK